MCPADDAVVVRRLAVPRDDALDEIHDVLAGFWAEADTVPSHRPPEVWRHLFDTAVIEVASNIVRHAYPSSARSGRIVVRLRLHSDRAEAWLLDGGRVFVEPTLVSPPSSADAIEGLPEVGYGLPIARAALDELEYRRSRFGTNVWHLVKYCDCREAQ